MSAKVNSMVINLHCTGKKAVCDKDANVKVHAIVKDYVNAKDHVNVKDPVNANYRDG